MSDHPDPAPPPERRPVGIDLSHALAEYQAQGSDLAVFVARLQAQGEQDLRSSADLLDCLTAMGAPDWVVTEAQMEHEFEAGFMVATRWIAAALEERMLDHGVMVVVHIAPAGED